MTVDLIYISTNFNIMKLHLLSTILFSSSWVKLDGVTYKEDAVILLKPGTDLEHPTFGQIKELYIVNNLTHTFMLRSRAPRSTVNITVYMSYQAPI